MSRVFMSYCRFENTAEALEEIINDLQNQSPQNVDFNSLSESEKNGYTKMIKLCRKILELDNSDLKS